MLNRLPQSRWLICLLVLGVFRAAPAIGSEAQTVYEISSPNNRIKVQVNTIDGQPSYAVFFDNKPVLANSKLGFRFATGVHLDTGFTVQSATKKQNDTSWEQPWGERRLIRDHHREMLVNFADISDEGRAFALRLRVFNDGMGFRYEVPDTGKRAITTELTQFNFTDLQTAWWIPAGGWNRYEYIYNSGLVPDAMRVHSPFTARQNSGVHVSIHEAALIDYAGFWLDQRRDGLMQTYLPPGPDGIAVHKSGAFHTPWRTIQIAQTASGLINSDLILNLNEPNKLGDVSWVEPGRYIGIWWCMHLGICTWGSDGVHGATTNRTREYIDFAAKNGFAGVLVEGWNEGWDGSWFANGDVFSFTKSYPDFDLKELAAYARKKGLRLIGHHETSGSLSNYEKQMQDGFELYEQLGMAQIKTGYVADGGDLTRVDADGIVQREWHDGQYSVNHHIQVLKTAARYKLSINTHEPVKDTGLRRTFPNWLTREGARGQEYNAWANPPNPPEHTTILPYTRLLSGPMDFTPGIFDLAPKGLDAPIRVQTTLMKQLALYVVIYSPVQMAADLPENYGKYPRAFQFIKQVPTDWEQSIALSGEVGEYTVMARQQRGGEDWYLGAISDEQSRHLELPLDFLDPETAYVAHIWRDHKTANWQDNPYAFETMEMKVTSKDTLPVWLAASGGTAIWFEKVSAP